MIDCPGCTVCTKFLCLRLCVSFNDVGIENLLVLAAVAKAVSMHEQLAVHHIGSRNWACVKRRGYTKGGFFQKVQFVLQISKKIFQKTFLNLKFKIPDHNIILLWAGISNFKFRIVFWNIIFGRFEKQIALSEKSHLYYSLLRRI